MRVAPPLIISEAEIVEACEIINEAIINEAINFS
jgi:4-aminobutyrate aminotransferase-like enzyme